MNTPTGSSYRHHALFYDSPDALLDAAVPFLRAGLDAGESAVLVCRGSYNELLEEALGSDPRLTVLDQTDVYTRTANAVAAYRRMMRRHTAVNPHRLRLVGEVAFGTDPTTWNEWIRFEAVVNAALAIYPLSSVCAYDTRTLPEPVLASAELTHPLVLTSASGRPNPRYVAPALFMRQSGTPDADSWGSTSPAYALDLTDPSEIAGLRHQLSDIPVLAALPALTRTDLIVAAAEVVTNGFVHGRPPVQVRIWITPAQVVCTITDQGPGFDDPLAGYVPTDPSHLDRGGAGLWLARQCCDRLDLGVTSDGFTVRLSIASPGTGSADS